MKRGFKLILFVALLAFATSVSADANLNCQIRNSNCLPSETALLNLSGYTNAHAQLINGNSGYEWRLCCKTTVAGTALTPACSASTTKLTALSSQSNAHVEIPGNTSYSNFACVGTVPEESRTVLCRTVNNSCAADEECLFSQSNFTNAHAGDCGKFNNNNDPYGWRNCCSFYQTDCGAEGQACCGGSLCIDPLSCIDGVCSPNPGPVCDGASADSAKLLGIVTNITGGGVGGATVTVMGKNSTTTNADGSYTLKVRNADADSPYDIIATHPSYETDSVSDFVIHNQMCADKDFLLLRDAQGCNADCTKADGLCHADCNGKGLCSYTSQESISACDLAAPGIITDPNDPEKQITCCTGASYTPKKANVQITCGKNAISVRLPVLFRGKFASMVLTVFDAAGCETS